jgi:phenylalanyl-tRNA synthetase beta chain
VTLANPISPERSALRRSILTGLLESARANRRHAERVALFELGPVFEPAGTELPAEPWRIGLILTGTAATRSWRAPDATGMDFYHAKGCVERLLQAMGQVAGWRADPDGHPSMHPGRTAMVLLGERSIGHVGELHPAVADRWDLEGGAAVADLDLDALVEAWGTPPPFAPFSPYPAVKEDLAVVVDAAIPAAEVLEVIRAGGGDLVTGATLFDVYAGRQIGETEKSLAWAITLQAPDRTLTGNEVAEVRARIVNALEERLGARLRS